MKSDAPRTIDDLCKILDRNGVAYSRAGNVLSAGGGLDLGSLTALPEGVTLSAGGDLNLGSLTALPEGVTLSAGGSLDLHRLTTLPEGVTLSAGRFLNLRSLTTLPEGVTLSAGGSLYLHRLTTLPEGVTLSAGGSLYLSSLTTEEQRYQGQDIRLRTIDGYCMRLLRSHDVAGATLWSAQYFRGDLDDNDPRCFVARQGDLYAHGASAETALRDLRFKIAQVNFDSADLVAEIKRRGAVRFNDYRLLTGACAEGLRQGLKDRGLSPDTEEVPLANALKLCRGAYGGERFASLLETPHD